MKLTVTSSPHIRGNFRTSRLMLDVVIALLPALAVGTAVLGIRALLVAVISVAAAVATEVLYSVIGKKRNTAIDGSAMVTGLLFAMTLPVNIPLWLAAAGSVFAILAVVGRTAAGAVQLGCQKVLEVALALPVLYILTALL